MFFHSLFVSFLFYFSLSNHFCATSFKKSNTSGEVRASISQSRGEELLTVKSTDIRAQQQQPTTRRRKRRAMTIKLKVGQVIGDNLRPAWRRYPPTLTLKQQLATFLHSNAQSEKERTGWGFVLPNKFHSYLLSFSSSSFSSLSFLLFSTVFIFISCLHTTKHISKQTVHKADGIRTLCHF